LQYDYIASILFDTMLEIYVSTYMCAAYQQWQQLTAYLYALYVQYVHNMWSLTTCDFVRCQDVHTLYICMYTHTLVSVVYIRMYVHTPLYSCQIAFFNGIPGPYQIEKFKCVMHTYVCTYISTECEINIYRCSDNLTTSSDV